MRFSNNNRETICDHQNLAICSNKHFRKLVTKLNIYPKLNVRSDQTGFIATRTNDGRQNALDFYDLRQICVHQGGGGKVRFLTHF